MDYDQNPFATPPVNEPPQPPRRRRKAVASIAAALVVVGTVGVGAGYAVGHGVGGSSANTASGSTQGGNTFGSSSGSQEIPGNPGWRWSTGGSSGESQQPTDPFGGQNPFESQPGQGGGSGTPDSTNKASAKQLSGLVRIVTNMKYAGAKAAGTGMVLTSDGEVVTNHHVVGGATSVKATVMSTGRTYAAKVVGTDTKDDVAVLQLTGASGLTTVTPNTSDASVGDKVTAVGDANGTSGYLSAASGKVLALSQSITTQAEGNAAAERLTGLMEISSDVVGGDSGGATYDAQGEVVGMTTAASSGGDIVGYAVPMTKVVSIAGDLESGVTSSRYDYGRPAFLGVGLGQTGTQVQGVYQGTSAAKAGITAGDTITAVDGTRVGTSSALHSLIAAHSPGDDVSITWTDTGGASHTATVTLGTGPVE